VHDEVGGLLTSLQMSVSTARLRASSASEGLTDALDQIETLTNDLAGVLRDISSRLRPTVLDDYGLPRALRQLARNLEDRAGLQVDLRCAIDADERLPSVVETTAYRVVQEALTNVVRHADTPHAQVTVEADEAHLRIRVYDDGAGFDPERAPDERTMGLDGMKQRVDRLDGTFRLETAPGEGTRLAVTLPLHAFPSAW
jgi:signal transduction histidine kinase